MPKSSFMHDVLGDVVKKRLAEVFEDVSNTHTYVYINIYIFSNGNG